MDKGLIPRRYAKALYEVGEDRKDNERLYSLMQNLETSFVAQPAMAKTLANPFVDPADKKALLVAAAGGSDAAADTTYADFLSLLAQNGRLDLARDIARAFVDLYRTRHDIYRVSIVSAAPMTEAGRKRLEDIISRHIGRGTMEYEYSIDPALIGGFTVTVNSERLDASVAGQLKELRRSLAAD